MNWKILAALAMVLLSVPLAASVPATLPEPTTVEILRAALAPKESELLDISLVIFDPGIPSDTAALQQLDIFPEVREAESRFLPFVLRQTLVNSAQWGAVRVLPTADPSAELLITGAILQSDGLALVLSIRAVDSTGRVWIDQQYTDSTAEADYQRDKERRPEPFQDLYNRIANDLVSARAGFDTRELENIADISLLRYAVGLSPDAFATHLRIGEDGRHAINSLPSRGDPMMMRVQRIREHEYLFIDTADEQYSLLHAEMAPSYELWRYYNRKQILYQQDYEERLARRGRKGRSGSYEAMRQTYNTFKWSKMQEQELEAMASGFNNEVAPTSVEIEGRVIELNGTLDSQYQEWRQLLHSMFALETGKTEAAQR